MSHRRPGLLVQYVGVVILLMVRFRNPGYLLSTKMNLFNTLYKKVTLMKQTLFIFLLFITSFGQMSLVGPRPLTLRDYTKFKEDWQRRRFSVKPGITCLWQISGRDSIDFRTWMKLDNQYIDTWTLLLDLKILLKTIPVAIFGKDAS